MQDSLITLLVVHSTSSAKRLFLGTACSALLVVAGIGLGAGRAEAVQGETPTAAAVLSQGGYSDLVEAGVHRGAVEALAADGVFDGTECEPGRFCPDAPLTRRTMAVWLVRVLDGGDPDDSSSIRFADVGPGDPWAAHIERLAELSVTRGCSTWPARFCPERAVTRAEAAAFLVRGFNLPPGQDAGFEDVASGSVFRSYIDSLAAAGITRGCAIAPARFCPDRAVTRAEMASFLHRARSAPTVEISWVDLRCLVTDVICRGLLVQLDGEWAPAPDGLGRWLECVVDGQAVTREVFTEGHTPGSWPPPHPSAHITDCGGRLTWSGWGGQPSFNAVHVIVDGVRSDTLRAGRL